MEFSGGTSSFVLRSDDRVLPRVTLQVPGRHYVVDAAGALVLGLQLVDDAESLARGLG